MARDLLAPERALAAAHWLEASPSVSHEGRLRLRRFREDVGTGEEEVWLERGSLLETSDWVRE